MTLEAPTALYLSTLPVTPNNRNQLATWISSVTTMSNEDISVTAFGSTLDSATIQLALDYVGALSTGGSVFIPAGVWTISDPLTVGSNTRVYGAGIGQTVLRCAAGSISVSENGTGLYAVIGAVGRSRVVIEDLTVDTQTNSGEANGIELAPTAEFEGTPCTWCVIRRCEVLSYVAHQYGIWSMRAQHVTIADCRVDGYNTTFPSAIGQEGIEVFGGYDVLVQGNSVRRMANAGLNMAAATDIPDAECVGLRIVDNYVDACQYGIFFGTATDTTDGPQDMSHVLVRGNVVRDSYYDNIRLTQAAASVGTTLTDVQIVGNTLEGGNVGIRCVGKVGETTVNHGVVIADNLIDNTLSAVEGAIDLNLMSGLIVRGNTISNAAGYGVYLASVPDLMLTGNRLDTINKCGVIATGCTSMVIAGNHFKDPSTAGASSFVTILMNDGCDDCLVEHNTFKRTTGYVEILINDTCARVTMIRNRKLYNSAYATPFSNQSVSGVTE